MSNSVAATIETSETRFSDMVDKVSVGYHEEIYVGVSDTELQFLAGNPSDSAGTYATFDSDYVTDVTGETSAYFSVDRVMDYLSLVSSGSSAVLEIEFLEFSDEQDLAEKMRVTPTNEAEDFEVTIVLPSGQNVFESVPGGLPDRFNQDDEMLGPSGNPLETTIETYVDELGKIDQAVAAHGDIDYNPVVVEGGRFKMDVGSESNSRVRAPLDGDVSGSDVSNLYGAHFKGIVGNLSGEVHLMLQDDSPMLVKQERDNYVVRHVLGAAVG